MEMKKNFPLFLILILFNLVVGGLQEEIGLPQTPAPDVIKC